MHICICVADAGQRGVALLLHQDGPHEGEDHEEGHLGPFVCFNGLCISLICVFVSFVIFVSLC